MKNAIPGIFPIVLVLIAFCLMTSLPVMWLWNYLCPEVFGLPLIGFRHALCMNLLCACLFRTTMIPKDRS